MNQQADIAELLPVPAPTIRDERLLLFIIRRLAAHGLNDAHAANAMLGRFGLSYKRPLLLMRALMAELARASNRSITVAPCCCARMTQDEARLIEIVRTANTSPKMAWLHLELLTNEAEGFAALSAAMALNCALADLGAPLTS